MVLGVKKPGFFGYYSFLEVESLRIPNPQISTSEARLGTRLGSSGPAGPLICACGTSAGPGIGDCAWLVKTGQGIMHHQ